MITATGGILMKKATIKRKDLKNVKTKTIKPVTLNNDVTATQELISILIKKAI